MRLQRRMNVAEAERKKRRRMDPALVQGRDQDLAKVLARDLVQIKTMMTMKMAVEVETMDLKIAMMILVRKRRRRVKREMMKKKRKSLSHLSIRAS
jgi:hypothetical protein